MHLVVVIKSVSHEIENEVHLKTISNVKPRLAQTKFVFQSQHSIVAVNLEHVLCETATYVCICCKFTEDYDRKDITRIVKSSTEFTVVCGLINMYSLPSSVSKFKINMFLLCLHFYYTL